MASPSDLAPALDEFCNYLINTLEFGVDSQTGAAEISRVVQESNAELEGLRFVEMIRESVDSGVSDIIERRLQSGRKESGKSSSANQQLAEKIAKTADFSKSKRQILELCTQASDILLSGGQKSSSKSPREAPKSMTSSVTAAWLGQSMSVFAGESLLNRAIGILKKKGAVAVSQMEVLSQLTEITSLELGQSPKYPELCESLEELFKNPSVSAHALSFLAKMFNAPVASVTVLTFSRTTKFLVNWSEELEQSSAGKQLDLQDASVRCFLMLFRLWHQMLMSLCTGWLRYPEQLVAESVNVVVELLSLCAGSEIQETFSPANPVLCLALIDPQATWFRKWMHGAYSRHKLISALKIQPALLRYMVRVSLYSEIESTNEGLNYGNLDELSDAVSLAYTRSEKKRALLLYGLRSLCVILRYSEAQDILFPVEVFENGKSSFGAASCFSKLIRRRLCDEDSPIPVALAARKSILELSRQGRRSQKIFFEWEVVEQLCNALAGKRSRREAKLTAVQVLLNLFRTTDFEEEFLASYSTFAVEHSFSLIRLAAEKDPSAPINLVLAAVELCTCLLVKREPRELLKKKMFLSDLSLLVREKDLDPELLLPFMASFDLPDDSLRRYRRSLFSSSHVMFLQVPVEIGPTVFDCFVKQTNWLLRSCNKGINWLNSESIISGFSLGGNRAFPFFPPLIFIVASQPGMAWSCLRNESFAKFLNDFLSEIGRLSASVVAAGLGILTVLSANLDFVAAFETEKELSLLLKQSMKDHCLKEKGGDELVISPLSVGLLHLYLNLKMIGGPKERNFKKIISEKFPRSLSVLEENCAKYFQAEPSRSLVKRISVETKDLPGKKGLMGYFYQTLLSRQRPPHIQILLKHSEETDLEKSGSVGGKEREQNWESVVDYCLNLGLSDEREKCVKELGSISSEIPYSTESGVRGTDWFFAVVVMLMELDKAKTVRFIRKFSACLETKTVWPYFSGHEVHTKSVMEEILPRVERLVERFLPRVRAALSTAGLPLQSVILFWINQCFLNVLDWPELCNYVTTSVLGGARYQAFFIVTLLKHMEEEICESAVHSCFPSVLVTGSSFQFRFHNSLKFMKELEQKH